MGTMSCVISITPERVVDVDPDGTGQGIELDLCIGNTDAQNDEVLCRETLARLRPFSSNDIAADDAAEVAGGCTKGESCGCSCKFPTPHLTSFAVLDQEIPVAGEPSADMQTAGFNSTDESTTVADVIVEVLYEATVIGYSSAGINTTIEAAYKHTVSVETNVDVADIALGNRIEVQGGVRFNVTLKTTEGKAEGVGTKVKGFKSSQSFLVAFKNAISEAGAVPPAGLAVSPVLATPPPTPTTTTTTTTTTTAAVAIVSKPKPQKVTFK